MRIRCAPKPQSGMTLVEILMAGAVLGIMASGIFGSFRYGLFTLQLLRENQRATQIILENFETLRLYNWEQLTNGVYTLPDEFYDPQGAAGCQGTTYNGTVSITNCTLLSSYAARLRQVTVTLNWTTRGTIPHNRSITTYIAKDGIQNYVW